MQPVKICTMAIFAALLLAGCHPPPPPSAADPAQAAVAASASQMPGGAMVFGTGDSEIHLTWDPNAKEYNAQPVFKSKHTITLWADGKNPETKDFYVHFTGKDSPCKDAAASPTPVPGQTNFYQAKLVSGRYQFACHSDAKTGHEYPYEIWTKPVIIKSATPCRGCTVEQGP